MAKQKGKTEYGGKRKQSHRGWAWNRVIERLDVPVERAFGVALLGPNPSLDLQAATSKGLRLENITAVDKSPYCVRAARDLGMRGIQQDVWKILQLWNDRRLDFVFLDTTGSFFAFQKLLGASVGSEGIRKGTVVYLNMLRGREPKASKPVMQMIQTSKIGAGVVHRGELAFLGMIADYWARWYMHHTGITDPAQKFGITKDDIELVKNFCSPCFMSYPSDAFRNHKMDSIVARWHRNRVMKLNGRLEAGRPDSEHRTFLSIKQKIAAHKAITKTLRPFNNFMSR